MVEESEIKESETFYAAVTGNDCDPRLKKSLERIKEVCDEIEKHGAIIYVGRVGQLCTDKFRGPTAQSIRNKPQTLKKYVELRIAEQKVPAKKDREGVRAQISDPKIRAYVIRLEEEVRDCHERIAKLKKLLENLPPLEIDKLIAGALSGGMHLALTAPHDDHEETESKGHILCATARRALEKITDETHLSSCGLRVYNNRLITKATSYKVLDKDEFQALRDLLTL